jgi:nucleoside-diphosphate-sugar epimerase
MRVVVIGATGNVGTSTVRALAADPAVDSIVGIARRLRLRPGAKGPDRRRVVADDRHPHLLLLAHKAEVERLLDVFEREHPAVRVARLRPGLGVPLMDSARARRELGWTPSHSAVEAFEELFDGLRDGSGAPTPPLDPRAGVPPACANCSPPSAAGRA